jgi:hypothetical protein
VHSLFSVAIQLCGQFPAAHLSYHQRIVIAERPTVQEPQQASELRSLMNLVKAQYLGHAGEGVDYVGLRQGPLWGELEAQLKGLQHLEPTGWPETQQRTFWINLYNVLVMHAVVVRGHPGTNPLWQLFFFSRKNWQIGGHRFSLDDLEHGILRGNRRHPFYPLAQFGPTDPRRHWALSLEPRIHFALNCGAKSCPPIGVYQAKALERQLELATASYIQSEVEINQGILHLPQILRWYRTDFDGRQGLANLLGQHLGQGAEQLLQLEWRYKPYDWTINALK